MKIEKEFPKIEVDKSSFETQRFFSFKHIKPNPRKGDTFLKQRSKDIFSFNSNTFLYKNLSDPNLSSSKNDSSSCFVTSMKINNNNRPQFNLFHTISSMKLKDKKARDLLTNYSLTELSNELASQFRTTNMSFGKVNSQHINGILKAAIHSNKYVHDMVSKLRYNKKRLNNVIVSTKHNLFREKQFK